METEISKIVEDRRFISLGQSKTWNMVEVNEIADEIIGTNNSQLSIIYPIIITLLLILLGGYLMNKHSLISSNRKSFIICGNQGVGKTNLHHLLTKGKLPILTVTTLEPKSDNFLVNEELKDNKIFKDIEIIDFPSNKKLKNLYLMPYFDDKLNEIQGIIYLIDSSNFDSKICHLVAEELLEIFTITESKPNGIDILIFANKDDLFTSKKVSKIKEMLEIEIGKIYRLKLHNLNKVNNNNDKIDDNEEFDNLNMVIKDGKFQFQLLEGNVDFQHGNIFKDNWSGISDWLYEKIVN